MPDPNSPDGPNGIFVLPAADVSHIRNIRRDLAYAEASPFHKLDLYTPETPPPATGWPLIIFIHGGAWMMCDKTDIQVTPALQALPRGYAVASVNYRLSSEAIFPAQIHDVKAAIRFLRARAATLKLDPARFAVWGGSAGAHLALHAGVTDGIAALTDTSLGHPDESSAVQAVISWFAPTDFAMMDVYFRETGVGVPDHSRPASPESLLIGGPVDDVPEAVRLANPETWVRPGCPPVLLQHGTADPLVPCQCSTHMAETIDKAAGKGRATLSLLPGAGHGGPEFETAENIAVVVGFLDRHLRA
jgi:acetyl esterase/lipase